MSDQAPLHVVVVEDDPRYRESLEVLLSLHPQFRLIHAYSSAVAAVAAAQAIGEKKAGTEPSWDLILMDLDLPGMNGIEATRALKPLLPGALVVILTVFEEAPRILEAICAGADGYLLKRTPPQELVEQLRVVVDGGAPLTAGVARTLLDLLRDQSAGSAAGGSDAAGGSLDATGRLPGGPALSPREREVLRALVEGLAYKQVAEALGISIDTVRHHVRGLYKKLQVHSVAEAVSRALRQRLV